MILLLADCSGVKRRMSGSFEDGQSELVSKMKTTPTENRNDDSAPGEGGASRTLMQSIGIGTVGLTLALLLTAASFYCVRSKLVWGPAIPVALVALGVAQIGVHLVFFLHITTGPDNANNILALAFGTLIVGLLVSGSLWIMANLNHNMKMPMHMAASTRLSHARG